MLMLGNSFSIVERKRRPRKVRLCGTGMCCVPGGPCGVAHGEPEDPDDPEAQAETEDHVDTDNGFRIGGEGVLEVLGPVGVQSKEGLNYISNANVDNIVDQSGAVELASSPAATNPFTHKNRFEALVVTLEACIRTKMKQSKTHKPKQVCKVDSSSISTPITPRATTATSATSSISSSSNQSRAKSHRQGRRSEE